MAGRKLGANLCVGSTLAMRKKVWRRRGKDHEGAQPSQRLLAAPGHKHARASAESIHGLVQGVSAGVYPQTLARFRFWRIIVIGAN